MSAIRRGDRRTTRLAHASPYARQSASKKSGWISGLLNFLNPLRSHSPEEEDAVDEEEDDDGQSGVDDGEADMAPSTSAAQALSMRGHQLAQGISDKDTRIPQTPVQVQLSPQAGSPHTPDGRPSPAQNMERVSTFLAEKGGQPLNEVEVRGLVSLIEDSVEQEKSEPFRFSSTPSRGITPLFGVSASSSTIPFPALSPSPSPRKTLPKNPNGVYRWQGAGSSRPRNRYQSPGFGSPRSTPRLKLAVLEAPKTDNKRRRVEEDLELRAPAPQANGTARAAAPSPDRTTGLPFPVSNDSGHSVNGVNSTPTPKVNGTPSRLRLSINPSTSKPSVPAVPSPLRQAWGQNDSSSPPQPPKPTKAANFMTELIKEVTPPAKKSKPDVVANPYQTASPVKPPTKIKKPVVRKRTRQAAKEDEKEKEKVEPSPQAIIEATVPKGSKRSRPPADLEKSTRSSTSTSTPVPPRRSPRQRPSDLPPNGINGTKTSPVVIDDEDEDAPVMKKQKRATPSVNGISLPPRVPVILVEEVDDVDMAKPQEVTKPSEVVEPSTPKSTGMDGFSFGAIQPVPPPTSGPTHAPTAAATGRPLFGAIKSSAPKEPSKLRFSYQADKAEAIIPTTPLLVNTPTTSSYFTPQPKPTSETKENLDSKAAALALDISTLPSYTFDFPSAVAGPSNYAKARKAATVTPAVSLPTFDFSKFPSTTNKFNWAAAGAKPPAPASGGTWQCDMCMLQNTAEATEKCAVCDAPRSKHVAPKSVGFDWAAAGIKVPEKKQGESWTCGTCMLSNPATAREKCTVCDTPR